MNLSLGTYIVVVVVGGGGVVVVVAAAAAAAAIVYFTRKLACGTPFPCGGCRQCTFIWAVLNSQGADTRKVGPIGITSSDSRLKVFKGHVC